MTIQLKNPRFLLDRIKYNPMGFLLASNWIADCNIISGWFEIIL